MFSELTSTQLKELELFYEESQHFEEDRFLQAGIIASVIVNWSGKSLKKGAKGFSPKDFMPYYKEIAKSQKAREKQSPEDMVKILKSIPGIKRVKRKKNG